MSGALYGVQAMVSHMIPCPYDHYHEQTEFCTCRLHIAVPESKKISFPLTHYFVTFSVKRKRFYIG
ncbi:hypothetical protein PR048_002428 [Dryococelus australis]|uniref:Uncharacterized protein n=1 Tax=Dryococelus australis TaxID=614101 RepID=A0ABQ9IKX2_9NEOP|nr:hypothetical protein PR048_002428 [Dryococelus australis]